jgi:hypothetical protein
MILHISLSKLDCIDRSNSVCMRHVAALIMHSLIIVVEFTVILKLPLSYSLSINLFLRIRIRNSFVITFYMVLFSLRKVF